MIDLAECSGRSGACRAHMMNISTAPSSIGASGTLGGEISRVTRFLERVINLNAQYRAGEVQTNVPEALHDGERRLDELIEELLPASYVAFKGASRSLFSRR